MQMEEPIEPAEGARQSSWALAIAMLRGVLDGDTYDAVASRHGITRTAVERRIKAVAWRSGETELGRRLLSGQGGLHVAGKLQADDWQGRQSVEIVIDDAADAHKA